MIYLIIQSAKCADISVIHLTLREAIKNQSTICSVFFPIRKGCFPLAICLWCIGGQNILPKFELFLTLAGGDVFIPFFK